MFRRRKTRLGNSWTCSRIQQRRFAPRVWSRCGSSRFSGEAAEARRLLNSVSTNSTPRENDMNTNWILSGAIAAALLAPGMARAAQGEHMEKRGERLEHQ